MANDPIAMLRNRLPRHFRLVDALRTVVSNDERLRWFELGCSLGAGEGDDRSDADVGIGYTDIAEGAELDAAALNIAASVGPPIDAIAHRMPGWPEDLCRVAAENAGGLQLDLVMMPAGRRPGLPDRTIALVDKDEQLTQTWVPPGLQPPSPELAREWTFLGWWALSAADKYATRGSWFEAVEALADATQLDRYLRGAGEIGDADHNALVHALNEVFSRET